MNNELGNEGMNEGMNEWESQSETADLASLPVLTCRAALN